MQNGEKIESNFVGKFRLGAQNEAREQIIEFCDDRLLIVNTFQPTKHMIIYVDITR